MFTLKCGLVIDFMKEKVLEKWFLDHSRSKFACAGRVNKTGMHYLSFLKGSQWGPWRNIMESRCMLIHVRRKLSDPQISLAIRLHIGVRICAKPG